MVPQRLDSEGNAYPHHRHYLHKRSVDTSLQEAYDDVTKTPSPSSSLSHDDDDGVTVSDTDSDYSTQTTSSSDNSNKLLYSVPAFGETLVLELSPDLDIAPPVVLFEEYDEHGGNATLLPRERFNAHCFHRGHVRGHEDTSDVALSVCHNMVSTHVYYCFYQYYNIIVLPMTVFIPKCDHM